MALTDFFRRASGRASGARAWAARHERLLWAGLIAAALVMQWPTIKGSYYRAVDTPAPPSAIEWRTDLDEALIEARRTQKQVLVDFSADWCPPCIAMKHAVWPDAAVEQAVTASYVPVLIDVDRNDAAPARYAVRGIPTIMVLDEEGQVVRRGTFLSASAMVRFLSEGN